MYKDNADAAKAQLDAAVNGAVDADGVRDEKSSLSARMVAIARKCANVDKFNDVYKGMREIIKTAGFTDNGETIPPQKVPQAMADAASACRQALKLGNLDKANSTEGLKRLNKATKEQISAETPTGFADYILLLKQAHKAASIDKGESPAQLAMTADLKALVDKYTKAAEVATGAKTPAKRKATKAATKAA